MDRRNRLAGAGTDGSSVRTDVGCTGIFAQLCAQYRRGDLRRTADDPGAAV